MIVREQEHKMREFIVSQYYCIHHVKLHVQYLLHKFIINYFIHIVLMFLLLYTGREKVL